MSDKNPKTNGTASERGIPAGLRKALGSRPKAKAQWKNLTPIARRDFITWIDSAKQEETHKRRIAVACSKLESGQRRPCCYAVVPMKFYKALGSNPKAKTGWKDLTPDERRDFIDWIESAKDAEANRLRVEKACGMIAAGKRRP